MARSGLDGRRRHHQTLILYLVRSIFSVQLVRDSGYQLFILHCCSPAVNVGLDTFHHLERDVHVARRGDVMLALLVQLLELFHLVLHRTTVAQNVQMVVHNVYEDHVLVFAVHTVLGLKRAEPAICQVTQLRDLMYLRLRFLLQFARCTRQLSTSFAR